MILSDEDLSMNECIFWIQKFKVLQSFSLEAENVSSVPMSLIVLSRTRLVRHIEEGLKLTFWELKLFKTLALFPQSNTNLKNIFGLMGLALNLMCRDGYDSELLSEETKATQTWVETYKFRFG